MSTAFSTTPPELEQRTSVARLFDCAQHRQRKPSPPGGARRRATCPKPLPGAGGPPEHPYPRRPEPAASKLHHQPPLSRFWPPPRLPANGENTLELPFLSSTSCATQSNLKPPEALTIWPPGAPCPP
jgi:hypothetical protein